MVGHPPEQVGVLGKRQVRRRLLKLLPKPLHIRRLGQHSIGVGEEALRRYYSPVCGPYSLKKPLGDIGLSGVRVTPEWDDILRPAPTEVIPIRDLCCRNRRRAMA